MSLRSLQSAIATLIRNVEHPRNIDDFVVKYDLTSVEKKTLENLIHQQRLRAYSEELFLARWTIIRQALEFLTPFIDFKELTDFWEREFDPKSTHIIQEDLTLRFLDFLVDDPLAQSFIRCRSSPFFPSLLSYVRCIFTFKHNNLPHYSLSPESLLTTRYFKVIHLLYDVREFFAELTEIKNFNIASLPSPPHKKIILLFVEGDLVTTFRTFEINEELDHFLQGELCVHPKRTMLPPCYSDLVDLDLLKPLDDSVFLKNAR